MVVSSGGWDGFGDEIMVGTKVGMWWVSSVSSGQAVVARIEGEKERSM